MFASMLPSTGRARFPEADWRGSERHFPGLRASCCLMSASGPDFWPAEVRDLSVHGIGLTVRRRFEPGTNLSVVLSNTAAGTVRTVFVRVVRVVNLAEGEWAIGAIFGVPLRNEDLQGLLK